MYMRRICLTRMTFILLITARLVYSFSSWHCFYADDLENDAAERHSLIAAGDQCRFVVEDHALNCCSAWSAFVDDGEHLARRRLLAAPRKVSTCPSCLELGAGASATAARTADALM